MKAPDSVSPHGPVSDLMTMLTKQATGQVVSISPVWIVLMRFDKQKKCVPGAGTFFFLATLKEHAGCNGSRGPGPVIAKLSVEP